MSETVQQVAKILRSAKLDLSSEKAVQEGIESLLKRESMMFDREFRLSDSDIIDFFIYGVGVEVKINSRNKVKIFRQLERYAKHEQITSLILVTSHPMGLPETIMGKDAYLINISAGWI